MGSSQAADIRLVCFDLGGVIVRTCASSREGCARAGVPYHPGADTPETRARIRRLETLYELGLCTSPEYFERAEIALAGTHSAAEIARIHNAWILGEYDGMERLVGAIQDRGVETACLSNTNDRHWELMTAHPRTYRAFAALQHRHASHLLGLAKPDPAVFRAFESQCGVPAGGIVFLDDREENVVAARLAGWRAEPVDPQENTAAQASAVLRGLGLEV